MSATVPRFLAVRRLAWILLGAVISCAPRGDRPDDDYDTTVATPAYPGDGPRVLFDEAHHNHHESGTTYRPFVRLIEADGYDVRPLRSRFTAEALAEGDILVISNAMGTNDVNDDPAFTREECDAVVQWVREGGSLLLITDHFPIGDACANLAEPFGVRMSRGVVEDSTRFEPDFDVTHLVYTVENGGLADHPIVRGRGEAERVRQVLTFTGQGLHATSPEDGFLRLGPSAVLRAPAPKVERSGGDVVVRVEYGEPVPARDAAQGVAVSFGKGRVVVLGDAAMLTAQKRRYDGLSIGMSTPGVDNRQLALNIMHWLSGLL